MGRRKVEGMKKSWCLFITLIAMISLIGTPSLASIGERFTSQSIAPSIPSINTVVERTTPQSDDIALDDPGGKAPRPW